MHVGIMIRKLRKEKKMTLVELSKRSRVALATLSRIENGRMTGTLQSHMNICKALEITLPELYKDLPASKKTLELQTKKSHIDLVTHDKRYLAEIMVSKASNKKMMPIMVRISEDGSSPNEETKSGVEKFVYILDGKVEAFIGEERYNLAKGDTLYFESSLPHQFRNTGKREARIISVTSPPAV